MALVSDMGVNGLGGEIAQPKIKNRFRVRFDGIGRDGIAGAGAEPLTLQVITVDRPKLSFEEITLDRYNSRAYIAGKHQFEPISITFEDDIGGEVTSIIQAQAELQQSIIGMTSAPRLPSARAGNDYKFSMTIEMLDGDNTVYERFILEGCYIANFDYGDLDYAASETVKIVLSIRFDHARQDITGISGRATGGEAGL